MHVRHAPFCPAFRHRLRSLSHQFFGKIALMEFVLKNPCQQLRSLGFAPCQRSYACPMAQGIWKLWQVLGAQFFGTIVLMKLMKFVSWKTRAISSAFLVTLPANEAMHAPSPNDCKPLEKSWAHNFSGIALMEFVLKTRALPMLFPTASPPSTLSSFPSRSFPTQLSPSYFPRFPLRPPCHRFHQAISHGFPSVHPVVASILLLPNGALPNHSFPSVLCFALRPPCRRFHFCSFPTELSPSYPSLRPVIASVSPLPNGTLPKLFPTVSLPSTLSSLPPPSFPTELSPSYFPRFPLRPPCRRFNLVTSPRSSPQAISHGFPYVRPVVASISFFPTELSPSTLSSLPSRSLIASVSLLPNGALPMLFPTVSRPSTLSSLPSLSFSTELSPSYFPLFPVRPACRRFHLAPSPQSSPQAISHGFPVRPPCHRSLLPRGAHPKLFPTVSSPSTQSLLPSVPSQRTSPQAISHCFPSRPTSHHFRIAPSRQVQLNENPSIGDAFGKKVADICIIWGFTMVIYLISWLGMVRYDFWLWHLGKNGNGLFEGED